jgi:hypothetical protein
LKKYNGLPLARINESRMFGVLVPYILRGVSDSLLRLTDSSRRKYSIRRFSAVSFRCAVRVRFTVSDCERERTIG